MKIAMICTPVIHEKVKVLFYRLNLPNLVLSEPLQTFDQIVEYLRQGVAGIIVQEGHSCADLVKTMGIPQLHYAGQKNFSEHLEHWIASLHVSLPPFQEESKTNKPEKTQQEMPVQPEQDEETEHIPEQMEPLVNEESVVTNEPVNEDSNHDHTRLKEKVVEKVTGVLHSAKELAQSVPRILPKRPVQPVKKTEQHTQFSKQSLIHESPVPVDVETFIFFSPESTGKTFVGINFAIALARMGRRVHFMDISGKVKHWFNAPSFPFVLEDIPLKVSALDRDKSFQADVFVIETRQPEVIQHFGPHKLFVVTDSDLGHQIETAKVIERINPIGMVWNLESSYGDPTKIIKLPVVLTLPRYADTFQRIEIGVPRAFSDDLLCNELVRLCGFDTMDYLMKSRVMP